MCWGCPRSTRRKHGRRAMRRLVFLIAPLAWVMLSAGERNSGNLPIIPSRGGVAGTQLQQCNGPDPVRAIAACTGIINSSATPTVRSSAYTNRGLAHLKMDDLTAARDD